MKEPTQSDGAGARGTHRKHKRVASDALPTRTLIVTGMHRSGTSLLTESLSALGWSLPPDRGGPSVDNPRGHFEPAAVVAANDRFLADAGSGWTRMAPFGPDEAARFCDNGAVRRIAAALGASFPGLPQRVVKDPRIALLAPLWREWIGASGDDVRLIVALRDPFAVAQSLAQRNGIPPGRALLAWAAHTLGALRLAATVPSMVLPFPEWVTDRSFQDRLLRFAALPDADPAGFADHLAGIFMPDAVHARRVRDLAPGDDAGEIARLAHEIYHAVHACAAASAVPDATAVAGFGIGLSDAGQSLLDVEREGRRRLEDLRRSLTAETLRAAQAQDAAIEDMCDRLRRTETEREDLAAGLAVARAEAEAQAAQAARARDIGATQIAARDADIAVLRDALARAEAAREDMHRQNATLQDASANDLRDRAAMEAVMAGLRHDMATLQALSEERLAAIAAAADRARELETANALSADDLSAARAAIAGLQREKRLLADSLMVTAERLYQARADRDRAAQKLRATDRERAAEAAWRRRAQDQIAALTKAVAEASALGERQRHMLEARLRGEEMTVFRPIYRNIYRRSGRALRRILRDTQVERLKRLVPGPDRIPRHLAESLPDVDRAADAAPIAPRDLVRDLPDIYVLSIINWDFRTQRPQHLARDWAAKGHRVFYVEMEQDLAGARSRRVSDNLHVLRLGGGTGDLIPTYAGLPDAAQVRRWVARLLAFAEANGRAPVAHVVIEHPYWWHFARALPPMFRLTFDCMDEMSGFSNTDPAILATESAMIGEVDHMIVSSQYLQDKHAPGRPVTLVRNAADIDHFIPVAEGRVTPFVLPPPTPATRLRAGYVGAIADWFDVDLIRETARLAPEIEFHLCGAVTNPVALPLRELPNVRLHGEIPYAAVPGFLAAMDVMTIPFRLLPIIQACDPVKFYEYAAAGKPVVATAMPELARAGDLVLRAASPPEFHAALLQAAGRGRDAAHRAALVDYARANTWADRGHAVLSVLGRAPRVSIVILAYGDPALTLTTVHSLVGQGHIYPEMEIIVVDNGSHAEAIATLRAYLDPIPAARLIQNGRNLGFAAGNNVGIAAATGDYVLLLNNDTFVPPGAIFAMVAHLERHPQIGVVGPMTNNIGNEARIEVNYADMGEMARVAAGVTAGYRGQWSEIPVVAYFCAMFRAADLANFGPLDDAFGRGMFEDDDHCARIRAAGYVCALAEDAFVHHHLSASFAEVPDAERKALFERNRAIYELRWGAWVPHRYRQRRPAPLAGAA